MSSDAARPKRKLPLVQLAILAVFGVAALVVLLRFIDLRAAIEWTIALIRQAGPIMFFVAMAVLPTFAVPVMAFTIPAGEAFSQQMGMGGVIAACLGAIATNLALSYWVSRYAFRPVLAGLIKRYGYSVPRVTPENALGLLLVVRLTPGPPYIIQCILLGLAEAPFRLYMIVSWLAITPWAIGGIVLGKGLLSGKFGVAATGMGVMVVVVVVVQWIRRKYLRNRQTVAAAADSVAK